MKTLKTWAALAGMVALTGAAQASLVLQSNGVEVLDTDTNLLWLYDWDSSGYNFWPEANIWAAGLTVGGASAGEWRLPTVEEYVDLWIDPDVGASEVGLGAVFSGAQHRPYYWSGTEATPGVDAYFFDIEAGGLRIQLFANPTYSPAVRSADAQTTVPEPQSLALVLLAGAVGLVARKGSNRKSAAVIA